MSRQTSSSKFRGTRRLSVEMSTDRLVEKKGEEDQIDQTLGSGVRNNVEAEVAG